MTSSEEKHKLSMLERVVGAVVLGLLALFVVLSLLTYRESYLQLRDREKPGLPQTVIPEPLPTLSPDVVEALSPEVAAQLDATWRSVEETRAAAEQARLDAEQALRDVDRTDNNLSQLFSFLQAASVLVGLALGAAAYFGFRSASQSRDDLDEVRAKLDLEIGENQVLRNTVRDELKKEINDSRTLQDKVRDDLNQEVKRSQQLQGNVTSALVQFKMRLDGSEERLTARESEFKDQIAGLAEQQKRLQTLENQLTPLSGLGEQLHNNQEMITNLMVATHELRLRNYESAYATIRHVLTIDYNNPLALYIAGWLELQYIDGKFEDGIVHLEQAHKADSDWPTAQAALGVARRRQSRNQDGEEATRKAVEAEHLLREALKKPNNMLIDLNQESLWGPVAGIQRDRGDYGQAIETYKQACEVTPGSSYPRGNLAVLYLHESRNDPELRTSAIKEFKRTSELALAELVLLPNDYFHMMDIAMSRTVWAYADPAQRDTVEEYFRDALKVKPSPEMLGVSRRGWKFLYDSCPEDADWVTVRQDIARLHNRVAFEHLRASVQVAVNDQKRVELTLFTGTVEVLDTALEVGQLSLEMIAEMRAQWEGLADLCPSVWTEAHAVIQSAIERLKGAAG